MSFDKVSAALDELDRALVEEKLTFVQYQQQHDEYLQACGWTIETYGDEIDAQWDDVKSVNIGIKEFLN